MSFRRPGRPSYGWILIWSLGVTELVSWGVLIYGFGVSPTKPTRPTAPGPSMPDVPTCPPVTVVTVFDPYGHRPPRKSPDRRMPPG